MHWEYSVACKIKAGTRHGNADTASSVSHIAQ